MSSHSQTRKRAVRRRGPPKVPTSEASAGFLGAWANMIPEWVAPMPRRRGRKPRVSIDQLVQRLPFHVMQGAGTLAEHFFELLQDPLANSSWSDRRLRLPWEVFADLMRRALRPLATRRQQPEAFWRGRRLLPRDRTP